MEKVVNTLSTGVLLMHRKKCAQLSAVPVFIELLTSTLSVAMQFILTHTTCLLLIRCISQKHSESVKRKRCRQRGNERERGTERESHYLTDWRFNPCLNDLKGWKIIVFKCSIQTTGKDGDGKRGREWQRDRDEVGGGMPACMCVFVWRSSGWDFTTQIFYPESWQDTFWIHFVPEFLNLSNYSCCLWTALFLDQPSLIEKKQKTFTCNISVAPFIHWISEACNRINILLQAYTA